MTSEHAELMREIDKLPVKYVREALDFVGFLRQKSQSEHDDSAAHKASAADPNRKPLSQYFGFLSPDTYGDGVAYQRKLRNEWDD